MHRASVYINLRTIACNRSVTVVKCAGICNSDTGDEGKLIANGILNGDRSLVIRVNRTKESYLTVVKRVDFFFRWKTNRSSLIRAQGSEGIFTHCLAWFSRIRD